MKVYPGRAPESGSNPPGDRDSGSRVFRPVKFDLLLLAVAVACGPSGGGDGAGEGGQTSSGAASGSNEGTSDPSSTGRTEDSGVGDGSTGGVGSTGADDSTGAPETECVSGTWRGRFDTAVFGNSFTPCGQDVAWSADTFGGPDLIYCEHVFLEVTGEVCPEELDGERISVLHIQEANGPCELPEEVACSDDPLFCYDGFVSTCTYDCDLYADECPQGFFCGVEESRTISRTFCFPEGPTLPLGEPCAQGNGACGAGAACLSVDGLTKPVCHALCDPEAPDACDGAGPCVGCTVQPDVGVCGEPTPPACVD